MDITDADLDRYLGRKHQIVDDIDDDDNDALPMKRRLPEQQPQQPTYGSLAVRSIARPAAPDLSALLKDYKGPPIQKRAENVPYVAYDVYAAALVLIDADRDGDIKLDKRFASELTHITSAYKHEYVCVDPPVLISDSVVLADGQLHVYLEEAIPISWMLLALFLHSSYTHAHETRSFERVKMFPFEGRQVEGAQSFGLRDIVVRDLEERGFSDAPKVLQQMQLHMLRIGELSSAAATDGVWIQQCVEGLAEVLKEGQK